MKHPTQHERLLAYFLTGRTLTRLDAYRLLGIVELSARVIDLERKGHRIYRERVPVTNRYGETVRVMRYEYVKTSVTDLVTAEPVNGTQAVAV